MDEEYISLQQLINIVNNKHHEKQYRSQTTTTFPCRQKLPPVEPKSHPQQPPLKTLQFKPWSGKTTKTQCILDNVEQEDVEPIQEQIENEDEQYEREQEQYIHDRVVQSEQLLSGNDVGYFYKFNNGKVKLIKYLLDENGFKDGYSNRNWTIYWSSSAVKLEHYHGLLPYQKINHFPNSFYITRKDLMNKAISKMQAKHGITHFNFLPKTYLLPQQTDIFIRQAEKSQQTYIVKPHNRSQGKGIMVSSSVETILSKLQKYSSIIVSHYIDNPLLINRLKFDLRIYVGVTGVNPLRIYVYEEGLARFATEQYDNTAFNCENKRFQHLTNYSINKKNTQFVSSSNSDYYGSKWSLTSLKDFLVYNIGKGQTHELFERIDDVIIKTLLSVENTLFTAFNQNVPYIDSCFEVFGFDILIDSNLKPWLMEVNLSPSMNTDSGLDLKIKGSMIADLFTLIGIVPLSQRYVNGGHNKYETAHYLRSNDIKKQNSLIDKFIIKEVERQKERAGGWRQVFPSKNHKYKTYFETERYFNRILRQQRQQPQTEAIKYYQYRTTKHEACQTKKSQKISIRINRSKKIRNKDDSLY